MERSHGLDVIRTIAILLVMVAHGVDIIYPFLNEFVGNVIHQQFGYWGVQLFFVLSGFLIGRILIKTYLAHEFNTKAIVYFWLRRWFRTVPNYFLFLLIYIGIGVWYLKGGGHWNFDLNHSFPLYYYPFFLQNFLTPIDGFFSQSWSLTIEEWFYITLPLFFFLVVRLTRKKVNPIALILLFILLNWCIKGMAHFLAPQMVGSSVIYSLDSIIYGVLAIGIQMRYPAFIKNYGKVLCCMGLLLFALAELMHLKGILPTYPFFSIVSAIAFAMIIPYADSIVIKVKALAQLVTIISKAPYTIYLSNFLMVVFFAEGFLAQLVSTRTAGGAFLVYSIYLVANIVFSYIHYKVFEVPVMSLRDNSRIRNYFEKERTSSDAGKEAASEPVLEVLPVPKEGQSVSC